MPEERVYFFPDTACIAKAERLFEVQSARLRALLPAADIQHVGSTAVPGSWTKGDLDIQVRVAPEGFAQAEATLAAHYERNTGSDCNDEFAAFKDDETDPPLGIQLTAIGSAYDDFCRLRDLMRERGELREAYNELKRRFEGRAMQEYRQAKQAFLEACLENP